MKPKPYYAAGGASAAFYDLVTQSDTSLEGDIDLYAALAPPGGSILELGAGTGRVSQALAERGFKVVGVEMFPAMLEQAEQKRSRASVDVAARLRYIRGDMTSLALASSFDAVICPYFALAHMPPGPAWTNTLKGVMRQLRGGGLAAFHMPIAARMGGAAPPSDVPVKALGELTLYVAGQAFNPSTARYDIDIDYVEPGVRRRERLTLYGGDLEPFALRAGLLRDRPPVALGETGFVHIFRKPG